ncbi:MAG: hypothetical protein R3212_02965, partial [Xanthomonadales bacterium]|nr:hypothetical protein [Xanthomonadales bacterium]
MEVDVSVGGAGGADYVIAGQEPSSGFLTFQVNFNWLGTILVVDDLGGGPQFVDTGVAWAVGQYRTLRVEVDADAGSIFYYYNGVLIYTSAGLWSEDTVEQVFLGSDNFHLSESGDFDNFVVQNQVDPTEVARFAVFKDFDDDNTAEVEVTLDCNTGLPLSQTTTISEGDPVNFVVGDFQQGTLDCTVTETVPSGYTASYDNGAVSPDSC